MPMSDYEIAQFVARRAMQLRMLIEGYFLKQGVEFEIVMIDDRFGDNGWLFKPGYIFKCEKGEFYLSTRGHTSKFKSRDPSNIIGWIQDDVGIQARLSNKNDIIAYPAGTPKELIEQVLSICNSAAIPN